jgi:hypothetical protein
LVTELDTIASPAVRITPAALVAAFQSANALAFLVRSFGAAFGSEQFTTEFALAVFVALAGIGSVAQTVGLLLFVYVAGCAQIGHGICANGAQGDQKDRSEHSLSRRTVEMKIF